MANPTFNEVAGPAQDAYYKTAQGELILKAREAVRYVKSKAYIGSNKYPQATNPFLWKTPLGPFKALYTLETQTWPMEDKDPEVASAWQSGLTGRALNLALLEARARALLATGAGNCSEMAAVAFVYLRGRKVRPLDYVHFLHRDHAFVVIGSPVPITPSNFLDWSVGSVLCDPLYERAEISGMLPAHFGSTLIESLYRLE